MFDFVVLTSCVRRISADVCVQLPRAAFLEIVIMEVFAEIVPNTPNPRCSQSVVSTTGSKGTMLVAKCDTNRRPVSGSPVPYKEEYSKTGMAASLQLTVTKIASCLTLDRPICRTHKVQRPSCFMLVSLVKIQRRLGVYNLTARPGTL